ncbi:ankyrin repeat, PH and SEC7 domain containing protein secG isoform X1 [Lingula anatina]|uniref:Ankyrin repeat, PH and SEC7 domain containing protein secG isoform X1 n=1 Tax=Lingula anatina TaxID=7574 RepID=A0A1S3J424_LINAN|nr:ankyrin repeat, PH and SEC7 domain containing protein secG isoform X1 [Lingula anatina]|eukprot:XP_013404589.1 ankyrin repeat, PH and SEC7 domain containing protein secG isoform X1 [Lingula anatina]
MTLGEPQMASSDECCCVCKQKVHYYSRHGKNWLFFCSEQCQQKYCKEKQIPPMILVETESQTDEEDENDQVSKIFKHIKSNDHTQLVDKLQVLKKKELDQAKLKGVPLLCYAVKVGSFRSIQVLLDTGIDVNQTCDNGKTALMLACQQASAEKVQMLLNCGVNLRLQDAEGQTALHLATLANKGASCAGLLLKADHSMASICDKYGQSALHLAAKRGHLPLVQLYLLHDRQGVKEKDNLGRLPLHWAVQEGRTNCVEYLLGFENTMVIDEVDDLGNTPIHLGIQHNKQQAVETLVDKGCNLDVVDDDGKTPLMLALHLGKKNIFNMIVQKQGPLKADAGDEQGMTALHHAADVGNLDFCKTLVEGGAKVDTLCKLGRSPIFYCVMNGHTDCVKYLMDKRADLYIIDNPKRLPLHYAVANGHVETTKLLISSIIDMKTVDEKAYQSVLQVAALSGQEVILQLLLKQGVDCERKDTEGCTALHLAAGEGHTKCCDILIQHGAQVNPEDNSNERNTPLDFAYKKEHADTAEFLRSKGGVTNGDRKEQAVMEFRRKHAAIVIQRAWRYYWGRKRIEHTRAARVIQAAWRAYQKKKCQRKDNEEFGVIPAKKKEKKKEKGKPGWNSSTVIRHTPPPSYSMFDMLNKNKIGTSNPARMTSYVQMFKNSAANGS